jgi:hypothetical protein
VWETSGLGILTAALSTLLGVSQLKLRPSWSDGENGESPTRAPPQSKEIGKMGEKLERITRIVSAGDEAHLRQAIESVQWERRGLFQRLVRTEKMSAGSSVPTA